MSAMGGKQTFALIETDGSGLVARGGPLIQLHPFGDTVSPLADLYRNHDEDE
jgi:hypothetical protein